MRLSTLALLAGLAVGCAKQKPPALPDADEGDLGEPGSSEEEDPDDESGLDDDEGESPRDPQDDGESEDPGEDEEDPE